MVKQTRGSSSRPKLPLGANMLLMVAAVLALPLIVNYELLANPDIPWVSYDDGTNFETNVHVQRLNWANIGWAINDGVVLGVYEPVSLIVKMWIGETVGFSRHIYMLASVTLHTTNSLLALMATTLFFYVVENASSKHHKWTTTGSYVGVAVLFLGLHPQRTEVLAWPSCFPYLLACLFALLSTMCHLVYHQRNPDWSLSTSRIFDFWTVMSVVFYSLAVLSKASTITLPVLLVAIDMCVLFVRENGATQSLKDRMVSMTCVLSNFGPMAVVTVVGLYAATSADLGKDTEGMVQPIQLTPQGRLMRACFMLCAYIVNAIIPASISVRCLVPEGNMFAPAFTASLAIILPVSMYCVYSVMCSKNTNTILGCLAYLVYVGLLFPCLGLVAQHVQMLAADRYSYVCVMTMGPAVLASLLAWSVHQLEKATVIKSNAKSFWPLASAVALAAVAYTTTLNVHTWSSNMLLWPEVVRSNGQAGVLQYAAPQKDLPAMNNMAMSYKSEGRFKEMDEIYTEVQSINSTLTPLYCTVLTIMMMDTTSQVLAHDPQDMIALVGKGFHLQRTQEYEQAASVYEQVIKQSPATQIDAYNNAGVMYNRLGRISEAEKRFLGVLSMKPDFYDARFNYGNMLRVQKGRKEEAVSEYKKIIASNPRNLGFIDVYNNLAATQLPIRPSEAVETWRAALKLVPHRGDMWGNLAVGCNSAGKLNEAVHAQERAIKIKPQDSSLRETLGKLKAKKLILDEQQGPA
jgi:tetratricopeptide (TPR) repeat protein